jgi:hypothetical protein
MFPIHASLKTLWVLLPPCQKNETEALQREADMIDSNSMTQHLNGTALYLTLTLDIITVHPETVPVLSGVFVRK